MVLMKGGKGGKGRGGRGSARGEGITKPFTWSGFWKFVDGWMGGVKLPVNGQSSMNGTPPRFMDDYGRDSGIPPPTIKRLSFVCR